MCIRPMILLGFVALMSLALLSCGSREATAITHDAYPDVQVAGAMKNVMWKGELAGIIRLEDIENKEGLYAIGPLSYLQGELLINDGRAYVSKVLTDTTMAVEATFAAEAPFLVYGNVTEWQELELPATITDAKALESAGAFAIVVEGVVEPIAIAVTEGVACPVIGIGASARCDGQVLVTEDMLGMFERVPRFVKRYNNMAEIIDLTVAQYAEEVRARTFPSEEQTYAPKP